MQPEYSAMLSILNKFHNVCACERLFWEKKKNIASATQKILSFWRTGWNKIIHLTDHFVRGIYLALSEGDIRENGTYITMWKLLSEEVQVYGSRARPFIDNKLSLSAWHTDKDGTNERAPPLHPSLTIPKGIIYHPSECGTYWIISSVDDSFE